MKINKIEPQGYCHGVINAINIANKILQNNDIKKPIYFLGSIIHNSHVIKDFEEKGIITIDEKGKSRLELLDMIDEGTVIFSAHGVSPQVYKKAMEKGVNIIDATCPMVKLVHNKMDKYLNLGYECIYIGTKNHPECEGVLGISDKIHFVTSVSDINNLNITSSSIYVTNQTTLSIYDIKDIFNELKNKYPSILIDDKICNATTIRQEAMANQKKVDLCIVVGDTKSSNTKKLVKVSNEHAHINTILCEDLKSLDKSLLKNVKSISISSGASTPPYLVDEIIDYIKKL
ncbi:MAG: 4-hydroxy-3-methylbut-2-enyl diphosphate reductase [Acholeplasmatales bacterium]|nr:4-hydroxy-3-methylbut-2-enyl diphosphate reductase [Acholeplasmatales bacterium]